MQAIYALVLATLTAIHPGAPRRNVTEIGSAIATTIDRDCKGDGALGSCALDAVTLAVTAEEEGRLCLGRECTRSDGGVSVSTMQVWTYSAAEADHLETDILAATRRAYVVLRASARRCPEEPLAGYVGGCGRRGARRLAAARLARARAILPVALVAALDGAGISGN